MLLPAKYTILEIKIHEDNDGATVMLCNEFGADCQVDAAELLESVLEDTMKPWSTELPTDEDYEFPRHFEVINVIHKADYSYMVIRLN